MYDVLEGVKVLEVAEWVFVPSAAATLADWGADVIKVEHPGRGDSLRGLSTMLGTPMSDDLEEVKVQQVNRGKRSIGVDISTPAGLEILLQLAEQADVFLTNFLPKTRARLGINAEDLRSRNPKIIYAHGSGWGDRGPRGGKPGFDLAQTWAASSFAYLMTAPDAAEPAPMPFSVGDLNAGLALAGSIAAALYRRERTGDAQTVAVSLYHIGMWFASQRITAAALGAPAGPPGGRGATTNPLLRPYRTLDNRWIWLVFVQPDQVWADLCRHLDLERLVDDPRFVDMSARAAHRTELVEILDTVFAQRAFADWINRLDTLKGVWAPVMSPAEVVADPHATENGYIADTVGADTPLRLVTTPMQFNGRNLGELHRMGTLGADTEDVLLELGYTWDHITRLRESHAII